MVGIVVGLFCVLIVAGISSAIFKIDLNWYISLNKPPFVVSSGWFTVFVAVSYISSIVAVSRLVHFKHFFPSLLFFGLLGLSNILFVLCFFRLKNLIASLVFITVALAMAYTLFIRFILKEIKIAAEFAPAFVFYAYAFVCVLYIAMQN